MVDVVGSNAVNPIDSQVSEDVTEAGNLIWLKKLRQLLVTRDPFITLKL